MRRVRKPISLVLIVTMVALNLQLTVFAEDNEALNRFMEYNKEKITLYPYLVEMYKYGAKASVGPSQEVYMPDGRTIYTGKEPVPTRGRYRISWQAFRGDRALTETELYELLGLKDEIEKAEKANKRGKALYFGGLAALVVAFFSLTASANKTDGPSAGISTLDAVLLLGGAGAAYVGSKTILLRRADYIEIYKMVQKHNLQLLADYFDDVNVRKKQREIERIDDLDSLYQYEYGDSEIKNKYRDKKFALNKIRKGMTKEEVLAVCGIPFTASNYNSLTSWAYMVRGRYKSDKKFDLDRLTKISNYTIYTLYFNDGKLVDWTEQEIPPPEQ